jgi:hypothetical protein
MASPDGALVDTGHLVRHIQITQREHSLAEVFEALEGRTPSIRGDLVGMIAE